MQQRSASTGGNPFLFGELFELIASVFLLISKARSPRSATLVVLRQPKAGGNQWETVYSKQASTSKELGQWELELRDNWDSIRDRFPEGS